MDSKRFFNVGLIVKSGQYNHYISLRGSKMYYGLYAISRVNQEIILSDIKMTIF